MIRALLVGCLLQAAALGWLALLGLGAAFAFPLLPADAQAFVVPAVLVTWVGTLFPVAIVGMVGVARRRNRRLDGALAGVGPGRALAPVARGWEGEAERRQVNAWFSKGPQLEIYVTAAARTDVGVGRRGALATWAGRASGREEVPFGEDLVAMGAEAGWTRALVAHPRGRAAIASLLTGEGTRTVTVQPEAVKLLVRGFDHSRLSRAEVDRLVRDLVDLAKAVETLPPPDAPRIAEGLVARMRTERGSIGRFFAVTFGCAGVLLVLVVVMTAAVMLAIG